MVALRPAGGDWSWGLSQNNAFNDRGLSIGMAPHLTLFAANHHHHHHISTPTRTVRRHHHIIPYLHPTSHCSSISSSSNSLSPPQLTLFAKIQDSTDFSSFFFKIPIF